MDNNIFEKTKIQTVEIRNIIRNIKNVQSRMKDDDVKNLQYVEAYTKLSYEFNDFFESNPSLFLAVVKGESLKTHVSTLYYRDKVLTGDMKESDLADMLSKKYFTKELKEESDKKLKEINQS